MLKSTQTSELLCSDEFIFNPSWCFPVLLSALCPPPPQARFWVQVMRDLREGVKLKKVQERQYNPLPIEYQLTPYEMLMDDIRSKRYKLRKVMVRVGWGGEANDSRLLHIRCTVLSVT